MHVHNVYFWLNNGLSAAEQAAFEDGLRSLTTDSNVRSSHFGKPAKTDRDVVENGYSYGLVLVFDDLAGHDRYQVGAVHLAFVDAHLAKWQKVIVHDIDSA